MLDNSDGKMKERAQTGLGLHKVLKGEADKSRVYYETQTETFENKKIFTNHTSRTSTVLSSSPLHALPVSSF